MTVLELLKEIQGSMFGKCPVCTFVTHRDGCPLGQAIALLEAKPKQGELVKRILEALVQYRSDPHSATRLGKFVTEYDIDELCDEIDRQEKEASGLSVAKVNAENECMVLKGDIDRLEAENKALREPTDKPTTAPD